MIKVSPECLAPHACLLSCYLFYFYSKKTKTKFVWYLINKLSLLFICQVHLNQRYDFFL
jgi:hypothetical protein